MLWRLTLNAAVRVRGILIRVSLELWLGLKSMLSNFFVHYLRIVVISLSVGPGKQVQHGLMYEGKAGAYPKGAPFRFSLLDNALFLLANIRIGWKSLIGTNTLAYFEHL